MAISKADLSRRFFLDLTASGHVFVREKGSGAPLHGALPVFSTETEEEAKALIVRHCRRARDGSGLYRLNDWPRQAEYSDLERATDLFRASYGNRPPGASGDAEVARG